MIRRVGASLVIAAVSLGQAPFAAPSDPHILALPYQPDHVVLLQAAPGYALVIELGDDEHAETVVVGSSAGWQVTANKRGDRIVIKPAADAPTTNLVVTTDVRRYVFLLHVGEVVGTTPFVVHFTYPELRQERAAARTVVAAYKLEGDKALFPTAIADDGERTTVTWSRATPLPAIYALGANGHEALINGRMVGGDYVIQGVAPRYVFRLGKARASAERRLITDEVR